MFLTAHLLLSYQRCARRAFLEVYGDPEQKQLPSDFLLKLEQDSHAHRQQVLAETEWVRPQYPHSDWAAGAAATRELMQQGVERIYHGVLMAQDPVSGLWQLSTPDLLIKQPGLSLFGDWLYTPTNIKFSRRAKQDYQIILTFDVQLLAKVQGAWPEVAWLYLRDKGWFAVDLWQTLPLLEPLLADLTEMLQTKVEPEVFIARNHCNLCTWFDHCYAVAQTENHLSLIPGITPNRYKVLQEHQLLSLEAIAATDPRRLEPLSGFGEEVAHKLVRQAQASLTNQPLPSPTIRNLAARTPLPTAPVELYFDIEAEPGLNLAFLHGVLVVDRQQQTQKFHPLLAEHPEAEKQAWEQFLQLVLSYPTAPIFHFCPYEVQTVERLGRLYQTPMPVLQVLLSRFFDLHDWVTQAAILPIESYTLKFIARWLGFHWRDTSANGAQAICWFSQWLETHNRQFLDDIICYNEDDCRATYHVKEWLTSFLQQQLPQSLTIHSPPLSAKVGMKDARPQPWLPTSAAKSFPSGEG
jgi:uncharacterized protein